MKTRLSLGWMRSSSSTSTIFLVSATESKQRTCLVPFFLNTSPILTLYGIAMLTSSILLTPIFSIMSESCLVLIDSDIPCSLSTTSASSFTTSEVICSNLDPLLIVYFKAVFVRMSKLTCRCTFDFWSLFLTEETKGNFDLCLSEMAVVMDVFVSVLVRL